LSTGVLHKKSKLSSLSLLRDLVLTEKRLLVLECARSIGRSGPTQEI
jgi:hypothetical protein